MARNFHAAVAVPVVYCDYHSFTNTLLFLLERGTTEFIVSWKQFTVDLFFSLGLFFAGPTHGVCWILLFEHFLDALASLELKLSVSQ